MVFRTLRNFNSKIEKAMHETADDVINENFYGVLDFEKYVCIYAA